jgi:hypothetical protein
MAKILDMSELFHPAHCNCCKTSLPFTFNGYGSYTSLMCACNNRYYICIKCLDEYRRKTNIDERPCTSCIREKNINEILIGF